MWNGNGKFNGSLLYINISLMNLREIPTTNQTFLESSPLSTHKHMIQTQRKFSPPKMK